jgi:phosphohistidine phosphatase
MEPRHLVLMRHAKSSWDDRNLDDHDRPLTARGRRAAGRVGDYLRHNGILPDVVLCSSATRTVQTLELLDLGAHPEVVVSDDLYGCGPGEMLARVRQTADPVASVLLIGHNPGIHELAVSLIGDPEAIPSFPTAGLADLRAPIRTWSDLHPGVATLHAFITPKDLD